MEYPSGQPCETNKSRLEQGLSRVQGLNVLCFDELGADEVYAHPLKLQEEREDTF